MAETNTLDMPPEAVATVWTILFSWMPKLWPAFEETFLSTAKPMMDYSSLISIQRIQGSLHRLEGEVTYAQYICR